jgi:hypothetical protein
MPPEKEEGRPFYRQFFAVTAVAAVLTVILFLMFYGCARAETKGHLLQPEPVNSKATFSHSTLPPTIG